MNHLEPLLDKLMLLVEILVGALFGLIFVLELVNIVLRHGFDSGIPQTTEAAAYTLGVVTFLGMAPAFLRGEHVNLEIARRYLPVAMRRGVVLLAELLAFLTLLYVAYVGAINVLRFHALPFAPASLPWLHYWIPMSAVPIGATLGALGLAVRFHRRTLEADSVEGPQLPIE